MRRTLAAIAAATIGILGLGVAGTANAVEPQQGVPFVPQHPVISEVSTLGVGPNATFKEFVEIANYSGRNQFIGGHEVRADLGPAGGFVTLGIIPDWTVLRPGEVYLLASSRFTGPVPDQIFSYVGDIPDLFGIALFNRGQAMVDAVGTMARTPYKEGRPATPLTALDAASRLSLTRVKDTNSNFRDFFKQRATPGVLTPLI